ncbi:MAG: VOC family protein [Bacteroidota bacterium]|nr:VOC family protein [Bacteroidota bacterium]
MNTYRLPAETHIGSIHLRVSNFERSLRFYKELLGFHEISRTGSTVELSAAGKAPSVIALTELQNARPKPPRTTGLYHVAIRFPNRRALAEVFANLVRNGWKFQGFADHIVSEALYLADPDNNGIELYVDRPREKWEWSGDHVAMGSLPLDVDHLLAEAGNSPAKWIDPGTDIGHVHLHVSDLGKAEKFYHGILGMDVTQRSYPGALFLSAGGYHHHIGVNVWAGRGAPPPPDDAVGLISFSVEVPDRTTVEQIRARAIEAGISPGDPTESGHRLSFSLDDEDKNRVVISTPRVRKNV